MGLDIQATWVPVPDAAKAADVIHYFRGGRRPPEDRSASGFVILSRGPCVIDSKDGSAEEASTLVGDAYKVGIIDGELFIYEHWKNGQIVRAVTISDDAFTRSSGVREAE